MSEELLPCCYCGCSGVKMHDDSKFIRCKKAFPPEFAWISCEAWNVNAKHAHELRQENARLRSLVERGAGLDLIAEWTKPEDTIETLSKQRDEARALIRIFTGRLKDGFILSSSLLSFEEAVARWEVEK